MPNYGYGYDPYNTMPAYGYQNPYSVPYTPRYQSVLPAQQVPQNVPQNAAQPQSNVPWIQVPNIEAARNVMVQPNQTAYMMNQNAPEFYVKATDAMGVATMKFFRFQEFSPEEEAVKQAVTSQSASLVSREEFNNFASQVSAQFNAIQQSITTSAPTPVAPAQTVAPVQPAPTPDPVAPAPAVKPSTRKKEAAET